MSTAGLRFRADAEDIIRVGVLTPHFAVGPEEELPAMDPGRVITCVARVWDDATGAVGGANSSTAAGLRAWRFTIAA